MSFLFDDPSELAAPLVDNDGGGEEEEDEEVGEILGGRDVWRRSAAVNLDGFAAAAEASEAKKPIDEDVLQKGESLEEYFCRRSHLRQMIKHCKELKKKHLGTFEQDTANYVAAMKKFKDEAVAYFDRELHNEANSDRLPDSVKQGLKWFEGLKEQFADILQQHSNIDLFGNQIVLVHEIWEALFNPRRSAGIVPMLYYVALAGFRWWEGMRPAVVLAGAASAGKTTLLNMIAKMMPPGVFDTVTHRTAMAATASDMNDLKLTSIDEAPGWMLGATYGGSGKEQEASPAASIEKSMATNKIQHTQMMSIVDGKRKRCDTYSSHIGTRLLATNVQLPSGRNPMLLRYIVQMVDNIEPQNEDAIERIMLRFREIELDSVKQDLLETCKLTSFYVMLFELMIAMGICEEINMDPFVVYFQRFCDKMAASNYYLREPKKVDQITELARTVTLVYAIRIGLFSEITYHERVDGDHYKRFFPNARFFLDVVERHLVCTRSIIVYVCSMCRDMWANKMQNDICASANKAIIQKHIEIFDASCFDEEIAAAAKKKRRQTFDRNGALVDSSSNSATTSDSNLQFPGESKDGADNDDDEADVAAGAYGAFDLDENNVVPDKDGNYVNEEIARAIEISEMGDAMSNMSLSEMNAVTRTIDTSGGNDEYSEEGEEKLAKKKKKQQQQQSKDAPIELPVQDLVRGEIVHANVNVETFMSETEINETLQMFMVVFREGDARRGVIDANYIELRGIQLTVEGACQMLIGQSSDGSIPSIDNLQTALRDMQRDEIMAPVYKMDWDKRKVVRTDEKRLIKKARFEKNTKRFDPNGAHGLDVTRIYLATHVVLNNHSLIKAVLAAIRGLGFPGTIPGRCVVNIPVDGLRNPKDEKKKIMTMHGINRVVHIVPRDEPFVFVKSATITSDMLDRFVNMRRGAARVKVSPTLLNSACGIYITVEPEITAAIAHAKICGTPRGTALIGTPALLDVAARRIARAVPELLERKLQAYPRDTMRRFRDRYMVFDWHNDPKRAKTFYGALPTDTDARRSVSSVVRDNPEMQILQITSMQSVRAIVNLIVPAALVNKPNATFDMILKRFRDPQKLREDLAEIGVTETKFMNEFHGRGSAPLVRSFDFEMGNVDKIDKLIKKDEDKAKLKAVRLAEQKQQHAAVVKDSDSAHKELQPMLEDVEDADLSLGNDLADISNMFKTLRGISSETKESLFAKVMGGGGGDSSRLAGFLDVEVPTTTTTTKKREPRFLKNDEGNGSDDDIDTIGFTEINIGRFRKN